MDAASAFGKLVMGRAARAETVPPPMVGFTQPELPDDDDPDIPEVDGLDPARESIMGATFVIEYRDSKGDFSRRRITALRFKDGSLVARCHERKAIRSFRCDRMVAVIDRNGEVYEPPTFFRLISFPVAASADPFPLFAPGLQLLAAVAHADGWVCRAEADKIAVYCHAAAELHGVALLPETAAKVSRFIESNYPTTAAVQSALDRLGRMTKPECKLLLTHAIQVMDADGEQHPAEFDLVMAMMAETQG